MDGMEKGHLINRSRNDGAARMAHARDSAAKVYQMHHMPAEHVTQQIGGTGQTQFRVFGLRVANGTNFVSRVI